MTYEELKEQILLLCDTASFDTNEETGEIVIYTNLKENERGSVEEVDDEIDPGLDMNWTPDEALRYWEREDR